MNRIQKAFANVRAEESLKQDTLAYLRKEISRRQKVKRRVWAYAAACAALLLTVSVLFHGLYTTPVSYISMDVNPSIELALNLFDRVVSCEGYNEDGQQLVSEVDVSNMTYTEAVETLLASSQMQEYLNQQGAKLVFTVSSDKEEELTAGLQSCQGYQEHHASCHTAEADTMQAAHEVGLSVGRYQIYQELLENGVSITPEECRNLSMRELRALLNEGESTSSSGGSSTDSSLVSDAGSENPQASSTSGYGGNSHHYEEEEEHGGGEGNGQNGGAGNGHGSQHHAE